jgi:hypothetical protein
MPTALRSFAHVRVGPHGMGWTLATVKDGAKTLLRHFTVMASHRHRLERLSGKAHCSWIPVSVSMSHPRQLPARTRLDDNTSSGTSAGTD